MSSIGLRIRKRREDLNLSQDELAKLLGYKSRSSINKIEIDGRNLPQNKIKKIAEALQTTTDYIMGWEENNIKEVKLPQSSFINIPVYQSLSCGVGAFVDENVEEIIPIPKSMLKTNKEYFANYAQGDSMIGQNIFDGDLIIFEKTTSIENGQIGSFSINEDRATCKIFKKDIQTGVVMLLPANNDYDPIFISQENHDFRVLGKLALVINNRQS